MTFGLFFDYLGVRLQLENGVPNHTAGAKAEDADATVTLSRATLNKVMLRQETLDAAVRAGDVKVEGDGAKLTERVSYLDTFEFWFNILTP